MTRVAVAIIGCGLMASAALAAEEVGHDHLTDLQHRFLHVAQGWGQLGINTCAHAKGKEPLPLTISGKRYDNGLGHHAPGEIVVDLAGAYERFEALVGLQTLEDARGSVVFQVYVDDEKLFDSGLMKADSPPQEVSVLVHRAQMLRLVTRDGGDGITCDCANWVNPRLIRSPNPAPIDMDVLEISTFADVIGSNPERMEGCAAGRTEPFPAADVYMDLPLSYSPRYFVRCERTGCIGLKWLERRRFRQIGFDVIKRSARPTADAIQVQIWIGQSAWQGRWQRIGGEWNIDGEFYRFCPDWTSVPEAQGATRKVRFVFQGPSENVVIFRFIVTSTSPTQETMIVAEAEGHDGRPIFVQVYNGEVVGVDSLRSVSWDSSEPLLAEIRHTLPRPWRADTTVLRFTLPDGLMFGVSMDDVLEHGGVYVKEAGVYVTTKVDGVPLSEYKQRIASKRTVLERVRAMPDQTFARAIEHVHNPKQNEPPTMLSLACDNHKFVVHRNGDIQFSSNPQTDAEHVSDLQDLSARLMPTFGSGKADHLSRHLDGEWMPIPVSEVEEGGVVYRQRTFVAPLGNDAATSVCVAEYSVENTGDAATDARVELTVFANAEKQEHATIETVPDGAVALSEGRLLAAVDREAVGSLALAATPAGVKLTGSLPAGATSRFCVFIPATAMTPGDRARFGKPADLLQATRAYWREQLASAMQVDVPDPLLANIIRASQVHCLIAARSEAEGSRVAPWIASISYGPLESEAHSIVRGMDFFGHHDFARSALDFFIHRYNDEGYLTTGYTMMGTGWHLWTLGEHYGLTRDRDWMMSVAPQVARVCEWIVAQREKTMQRLPGNVMTVEHGLMPPGVMADWNAYAYHFCLNGYYCAGLRAAAKALADVGIAEAGRFQDVATQFRNDILRAYSWTRSLMPAYRLADGTSVPGYPSQVHTPGPVGEFFAGQDHNRSWCYDVELGGHHLVPLGVVPADSPDVGWMMNHMEDVQFLSEGWFDYPAERSRTDWYNLGGFAKVQPYYCRNAEAYAMRDDVKPFVRSYFNTIPSLLNTENLSFMEHFAGVGAWNKTHETGYFLHQTRLMLLAERGEELWLAPFVTDNWLEDGMSVGVVNAPTLFGPTSYRIDSHVADGHIDATIEPPGRFALKEIVVRLRHPEGKPMRMVSVNGRPHENFDVGKQIVRIEPGSEKVTVRAEY